MGNELRLDKQLCFALYAAQRKMVQSYQQELQPLGLTYPQYLVLLVLWESDGVTVGQLGARLLLDSGTLTPLLKRMEVGRLIRRARSSVDERRVEVHLTPAGRALKKRATRVPGAMFERTKLSVGDAVSLKGALSRLTHHLHVEDST